MFQGFSKETSEFLWELSFHNERPWFLEHKEQFERVLNGPFQELTRDTGALLQQRCPYMEVRTHASRIYRDARRLFGRGPYKDHLWSTFKDGANYSEGPMFWFEISAATYSYGLGFFDVTPAEMAYFRKSIDAEPARFERLAALVLEQPHARVIGPTYARPKGSYDEPIRSWYERKWAGVEITRDLEGEAFTERLPQILVDCFEAWMPMYEFLLQVHRGAGQEGLTATIERSH